MSTFSYQPDATAVPGLPWNVTYLSQRDVTANIPINFVTRPGVSLTTACFINNRYEVNAAAKCISNLLAAGFGRWEVDLYWNIVSRSWTLCPVEIPAPGVYPFVTSSAMLNASSTVATNATRTTRLGARSIKTTSTSELHTPLSSGTTKLLVPRASSSSVILTPSTITASTSTSANSSFVVLPTPVPGFGEPLYQVGPYTCSRSLTLSTLSSILGDYLGATDNTLEAFLYYFTFNLHIAASYQDPSAIHGVPTPNELPNTPESLSNIFNSNFSMYLYTPSLLVQQRQNLNASWLSVTDSSRPATSYITINTTSDGTLATPDGWPSQSFLEIDKQRRLLISLGNIDPNFSAYNTSGDSGTLWLDRTFEDNTPVNLSADGLVTYGCLFQPASTSLQLQNSSWAAFSDLPQFFLGADEAAATNSSIPAISNITACGISSFLNETLLSTTADIDIAPYIDIVRSSIWSWAYGQPTTDPNNDNLRCAVMDTSLSGNWRVADCYTAYRGACRTNHAPYNWTLTTFAADYRNVNVTCPSNTTFATPRTALENSHLLNTFRTSAYADESNAIWLNFNSIQVDDCWVVGVGTACPYSGNVGTIQTVTVPVVAGVIILVLALLLVVVKCGANRRNSRRKGGREEGIGQWEYEGVPA